MIFSPDLAKLVARGKKTQTRRPVQFAKLSHDQKWVKATQYKVGRTYAVQPGRGRHAIAHITITTVTRSLAGDIDYNAARAEGFLTRDDFKTAWVHIHDRAWIQREHADQVDIDDDALLLERFLARHARTPVWVIEFELAHEQRRLLGPLTEDCGDGLAGYTTQPARALHEHREADALGQAARIPEPEPVDATTLERYTIDADQRGRAHRGLIDQKLLDEEHTLAGQLAAAVAIAKRRGVNINGEVRVIQKRLDAIKTKIAERDAA